MHILSAILIITIGFVNGSNDLKLTEAVNSRVGLWKLVSIKYTVVLTVVILAYDLNPTTLIMGCVILSGNHRLVKFFADSKNEGLFGY
jgi:hypothetical protein